jgi:signal transduction histidine kinase
VTAPLDILLVDDNALDRELVRRYLPSGHNLRTAATAAEAKQQFYAQHPDIVLLDYRLPDADGVKILPEFVIHHVPVVMLTGMEAPEIVVEVMQAGAHDYIVKNHLSSENLEHAMIRALDMARLQRAVAEQQKALQAQAAALEAKNREITALASALTLAEQAERRRLADLLHDHLQQLLFGVRLSLCSLVATDDPTRRTEQGAIAEDALLQAIETTRNLAVELTPPVLDREEIDVAFRWLAHHMGQTYGLQVEVVAENPCRVTSRELRVLLLQFVRELLFNVVKHAGVDRATIRLTANRNGCTVSVVDEGCGFDPHAQHLVAQHSASEGNGFVGGFGLFSVRERLELLGGTLEVESSGEGGTRVTIRSPLSVGLRDGESAPTHVTQ